MNEQFKEGYDAHARGVRRGACPHPDGSDEREAWLDGWDEAEAARNKTDIDQAEEEDE